MKKMKKLLLSLLIGTACASMFAFAGCLDSGNNNEGDLPDESTDITEEDVPLGGSVCGHEQVNHVHAVSAGCETAGNKEYWYCSECNKYFSDEDCTIETSFAAVTLTKLGHSYGGWIEEDSATCTEDGVKAHKDCTECGKHFDAENNEITDLTIAAGHNYGEWIEEVPAHDCTDGVRGHYHCDGCGADFNESYVEFGLLPFQAGSLTIAAPHNIKDYPAEDASCLVDGHDAYRQCEDCGKYFDEYGNVTEAPMFIEGHHAYGEFVYDYEAEKYVKTCKHSIEHKIEQVAGTAEYPYLAKDADSLKSAVANGGYVKLVNDIVITEVLNIADTVNIDLNGNNISNSASLVGFIKVAGNKNITVTLNNGTLNNVYTGTTSTYTINVVASTDTASAPHVILNGITVNNTSTGLEDDKYSSRYTRTSSVYLGAAAHITLTDCELNYGYYGFNYKNNSVIEINGGSIKNTFVCLQGNGTEHGTAVTLNNVDIETYFGIYHPQDGVININGGRVAAVGTALEVRAGTATVKDVQLSSTYQFGATYQTSANSTSGCAIAVSQHSTDRAINVTVEGCTLTAVYAIFEKDLQNNTARDVISITLGEGNTYNGCIYSENCANLADVAQTGHNCEICGATVVSTANEFVAAIANGGYILLSGKIDLSTTETSDDTYYNILTDTVIDLNGYTVITKMGFSVGIKDNAAAPVLTVKNGTINRVVDSGSTAMKSTVAAYGNGELVIENCTITTNQDIAVTVWHSCKVTVTDSTLKGVAYALSSSAGAGDYTEAMSVKLTNCSLDAQGAGILWNIPASIEIDGCEIKGLGQAMIARGGNITISNSTLIKRAYVAGVDLEMLANGDETAYPQYENKTWGNGNYVPGYALVVGNRSSSYQYATNLTLNNVKVQVEDGVVEKYVYAYGNTNPAYGATITYDADCELVEIVIGDKDAANGSNVTVNAPENAN